MRTKKGYNFLNAQLSHPTHFHALGVPVCCTRLPRLSWLESVSPETSSVGPTPAPLAIPGVTDGGGTDTAADCRGMKPASPPNAPDGFGAVVGTAALPVPGMTSVLVSELARPGGAARVEDPDAAADVSEMGAPTMGAPPEVLERPGGALRVPEASAEEEAPGGWVRPGWLASV